MTRILITGGHGQVATAIKEENMAFNFDLLSFSQKELNITNPEVTLNLIEKFKPDCVINTAAYTAVDKAEENPEHTFTVNYIGPIILASVCKLLEVPLIHLSTDYVFDGKKSEAYDEADPTNPINIYGKSKLLGEEAIRNNLAHHIILRASAVFSAHGNNFVKTIINNAATVDELKIVSDQTTCPTSANDIAEVCLTIAKQITADKNNKLWGTYHYSSEEPTSWYDFSKKIIDTARQFTNIQVKDIKAVSSDTFPTLAKRPQHTVLDSSKIKSTFNISTKPWSSSIQSVVENLCQ